MNLCIDVGNTRVKMAIFDSDNKMQNLQFSDDLEKAVLLAILKKYNCKNAILSSVRGEHKEIQSFLSGQLKAVFFLDANLPIPIQNEYKTPQTLGKDRLAAVVGATQLLPNKNVLVVDAGTCITYDFITKKAIYKGGNILPGVNMRLKSMAHFTAQLPLVKPQKLNSFVGQTTKTAMQTGVLYGVLHELSGFRVQYETKYGNIEVIVTGGDTSYFESQFKNKIFAEPNLVFIGLNKILNYNINL